MNWKLWSRQLDALVRLELRSFLLGRRLGAMFLAAYAPVALLLLIALRRVRIPEVATLTENYAAFFQIFMLRFALFIACGVLFSQLYRGAILEKTLHFFLLTPARRGVIAVGRYVAGLLAAITIFGSATVLTHLLLYWPSAEFSTFFFSGPGFAHMARYLTVIILACITYGAVFVASGLLFKNPGGPIVLLMGWEGFNSFLPSMLQRVSIIHYLQPILPVTIDRGPFAVVTDPTPVYLGIPLLLLATAVFLAVTGWLLERTEVTYSAE